MASSLNLMKLVLGQTKTLKHREVRSSLQVTWDVDELWLEHTSPA